MPFLRTRLKWLKLLEIYLGQRNIQLFLRFAR